MLPENFDKIIEALLLVSEKPLTLEQLKEVFLNIQTQTIKTALENLKNKYNDSEKGIQIQEVAGGYQFCTHPDCSEYIKKLYKVKRVFRLTAPSLETLAIIAYRQPVTRTEIEAIRGVNVDGVIKNLLERGLIKIKGRKEVPGRPIMYGTTNEFLQYFGLKSLDELPSLEEFTAHALANDLVIDSKTNEGEIDNGQDEHTQVTPSH